MALINIQQALSGLSKVEETFLYFDRLILGCELDEKDLPKKKQHYVPQVYLRGFSPEYKPLERSIVEKDKFTICII